MAMPTRHLPERGPVPSCGPVPSPGPVRSGRSGRSTALAALAVAVLLSACGGGDKSFDDGVSSAPMPAPAPAAPMPEVGFDMGRGGTAGSPVAGDRVTGERAVVRNASIELVVDDGAAAIDAAEARAIALGGSVASGTRSRDEDGTVSGTLMLRVPSDRLDELVEALDALARSVPMRSIDEYDVTMQLSDIDAQLANLRAFEAELRALLTEVRQRDGTVEGLVAIADSLRQVRTEIDIIEARRIQLTDQVELSTVWVYIRQARSTTPVVGTWDLPAVVRDALAATVRLAQLAVEGVVWFVLTVVPALVVLALAVWVVRTLRRRRSQDPAGL
jgi:hypothetical protein